MITREQVEEAYDAAMFQMARLNKNAAMLMHKYNAHAATDVTGFGELLKRHRMDPKFEAIYIY